MPLRRCVWLMTGAAIAGEFSHHLAWSGDDGRRQVERLEHEREPRVIQPAQVFVGGKKQTCFEDCGLGHEQGIIHLLIEVIRRRIGDFVLPSILQRSQKGR